MARWSLELRYAGEAFTADVDLDVQTSRELISGKGSQEPLEVSVDLNFPFNIAELVEKGNALDAAEGDLTLDGKLIMRGRVVDAGYGDPEAPLGAVSVTLRSSPLEDRALFPDSAAIVTSETWPYADPAAEGKVYPQVFGEPGAAGDSAGSPAYLVQTVDPPVVGPQYVLVCDGWSECTSVTVMVPSGGGQVSILGSIVVTFARQDENYTIIHGYDGNGRRVSYINLWEHLSGGVPTIPYALGTEFHAIWTDGAPFSGKQGDLLDRMHRASSGAVDLDRLAVNMESLNLITLAGYLDEQVVPTEWISENLLPLGSVGLVASAKGLYPVAIPIERTAAKAAAHLEVGPGCEPVGGVRWEGDPVNDLTLKYRPRSDASGHLGTVLVNPDNDAYADASRRRYEGDAQSGVYAETIETDVVHDEATAQSLARDIVRRRWARERLAEYRIWPEFWGRIEPGQVVTMTDPDRSWTRRPALVVNRDDDKDATTLTLSFDDDPFRDLR
jgi:hypothetical protein